MDGAGDGNNVHRRRARIKLDRGAPMNGSWLAFAGRFGDFVNSFKASAMGCGNPCRVTLLGPLRVCLYPKIFRSRRVKKAILARAKMIVYIVLDVNVIMGVKLLVEIVGL